MKCLACYFTKYFFCFSFMHMLLSTQRNCWMEVCICSRTNHSISNTVLHICIQQMSNSKCGPEHFTVLCFFQTFESKINHLETRQCRKLKDNLGGLEYFVRCEVHLSDVNTLISSIKRNAEDVKTTKEVKCNIFSLLM